MIALNIACQLQRGSSAACGTQGCRDVNAMVLWPRAATIMA